MKQKIQTGEWEGVPIYRQMTAGEMLWEAIKENHNGHLTRK